MHAWHIILAFGVLLGAALFFPIGAFFGRYLTLRKMTLRGKPLDAIGSTYGWSRMVGESDAAYRDRLTNVIRRPWT